MKRFLFSVFLSCYLAACGGGGGGGGVGTGGGPVPPANVLHDVNFHSDSTMTVKLAIQGNQVINLVRGGTATSVAVSAVKTVVWNSQCKGWVTAGGTGIQVTFASNFTTLSGLTPSDRGLVSILLHDGTEYSLNTDHVTVTGGIVRNGGLWYGDTTSAGISCPAAPTPPVVPVPVLKHEIVFAGSSVTVKLAVQDGQVLHLTNQSGEAIIPVSSITHEIWNDSCVGWRMSGGSGIQTTFTNNQTVIQGLNPSGRGMVTVLAGGQEYSLNLDFVIVNGGIVRNGGLWYGDTTSPSITCPTVVQPPPPPPVVPPTIVKHEIEFKSDSTMTVKLAVENGEVLHVVRNGVETSVSMLTVQKVIWNSHCKGWRVAGGTGIQVSFTSNLTTLGGLTASDRGLISVLTLDGLEYYVNLDFVTVTGGIVKEGGLWYGDTTSPSIACPA